MPEREPQQRRRRPGRRRRRRFQEGRLRAAMRRRRLREAGIPESQIRVAPPGPAPGVPVPDVMPTLPPPEEWHQKTGARVAMVAGGLGLAYLLLRKK